MIREIAKTFFGGVWELLLQTDYPGLGVSVAGVMVSFFLIQSSISLFKFITGFSAGGGDYGRAASHMDRQSAQKGKYRKY